MIMADKLTVNEERIRKEFCELVEIDSVSFQERQMADRLTEKLKSIGFTVEEDDAGSRIGGNAGNLFGVLKGGLPGSPILLSGHMDTVEPGIGKKAVCHEDGRITSRGDTVLGADDLAAVVEILEGIRIVREAGLPHRDIELLLVAAEEPFTKGSSAFDFSRVTAKEAYVLDVSGPVGKAILKAPTILSFEVQIKGRAAHAGFEPEKGIHSIQILSRGIGELKLGRVDEETTLNIGLISGGSVVNAVPEYASCRGEIRSYDHEKALRSLEYVRETFVRFVQGTGAELVFTHQVNVKAFQIQPSEPVVAHFTQACRNLGIEPEFGSTFGGSDGNTIVQHGIPCAVLSCGMYEAHSVREYTRLSDMADGARMVAELIRQ